MVGILDDKASPATPASAPRALALDADMGGAASCGMRKGRTILPRTERSWRRPSRELDASSSRSVSRAGTMSSIARCPMALNRASKALPDATRTSLSLSQRAWRTVRMSSSMCWRICCFWQLAMTSESPRQTPALSSSSSASRLLCRMGITSCRTRSPSLPTISPIDLPATNFLSSDLLDRQRIRVSISVLRMFFSVRSCDCTTDFHTWKLAEHTD
mmetsp:Transcript_44303/g.139774  ORF Transcript_44303/g.139774 Transcript_44303/m.139774 type:complete len:216 (+) Transcript_44303:638-1285(+)